MAITTSVCTGGTNSHTESSENMNALATDFISEGVVGSVTNTSGVSPATGAFAVNAQGTPDMTVAVTQGIAYVTGTPTGGNSQTFRVNMDAAQNVTISANSSGSTKYDWLYIKLDPSYMQNPDVNAQSVASLVTSRSTSSSTDDGTPPTYGFLLAKITVTNGAASITNSNITDSRTQTGSNALAPSAYMPNNVVTGASLATSAITLGYASSTSTYSITNAGYNDVTGLSVTVTVPSGGRNLKITAFSPSIKSTSAAGNTLYWAIRESSTVLNASIQQINTISYNMPGIVIAYVSAPSAGSHTYKVSMQTSGAGSVETSNVSATTPAFILVELI